WVGSTPDLFAVQVGGFDRDLPNLVRPRLPWIRSQHHQVRPFSSFQASGLFFHEEFMGGMNRARSNGYIDANILFRAQQLSAFGSSRQGNLKIVQRTRRGHGAVV